MTADMSTSLKVVSIAASCWAATRRCAIFARSGDILRRVWRPVAGDEGGTEGAAGDGRGAVGEAAGDTGFGASGLSPIDSRLSPAPPLSAAAIISPLVTRPAFPVPATDDGSIPVSPA